MFRFKNKPENKKYSKENFMAELKKGNVNLLKQYLNKQLELSGIVSGSELLSLAAETGNQDYIPDCIQALDNESNYYKTVIQAALLIALSNNQFDFAEALMKSSTYPINFKLDCYYSDEMTILMMVAEKGLVSAVNFLLKCGADVDVVTKTGITALILAAHYGHLKCVQVLLRVDTININSVYGDDHTALAYAAMNGHLEIVKLLRSHPRILVNMKNNKGLSAVDMASHKGQVKTLADLLGDSRIEIHNFALIQAASDGQTEAVKLLLADGRFNVNSTKTTKNNELPLNVAIKNNHIETVKVLICDPRTDVNCKNYDGNSPLLLAAQCGFTQMVNILLTRHDIDLAIVNNAGSDAMMLAAYNGHLDVIKALLSTPIDVRRKNQANQSALDIAKNQKHVAVVTFLQSVIAERKEMTRQQKIMKVSPASTSSSSSSSQTLLALPTLSFQAQVDAMNMRDAEIDDDFKCPLDLHIMNDPVTVSSGITYDRASLKEYFEKKGMPVKLPCPMTGREIYSFEINNPTSIFVKKVITKFIEDEKKLRSPSTFDPTFFGGPKCEQSFLLATPKRMY